MTVQINSYNEKHIHSRSSHGGRCKLPMVFTEHGAIMAANVLNSPRAVQIHREKKSGR
jgi:hypothetical protein